MFHLAKILGPSLLKPLPSYQTKGLNAAAEGIEFQVSITMRGNTDVVSRYINTDKMGCVFH